MDYFTLKNSSSSKYLNVRDTVARRMSKRYSISRHVFSSIWCVREATELLIRAQSSTTQPTFGRNTGSFI
jgi:hypothetical protein